jgi:hypothetical protein
MRDVPLAFAAAAAPSIGPAVVTLGGIDVPVMSVALSACGLVLARFIAPAPVRKLSRRQESALTGLLLILLFVIVTGQFSGAPMGAGMAVIWGVGLGFSGLLVVEFFGERAMAMLRAAFGTPAREPPGGGDEPEA